MSFIEVLLIIGAVIALFNLLNVIFGWKVYKKLFIKLYLAFMRHKAKRVRRLIQKEIDELNKNNKTIYINESEN